MVMIDLTEEKKSLGVISVTRVTTSSLLRRAAEIGPLAFAQLRQGGVATLPDREVQIGQLGPVKKK
jgi:hypothetical protein